ncbi:MAG: D-aminoacylase [Desulfurococcaceae archaeon]
MATYDIVIKHGKVFSGSGSSWFYADIGIKNGIIKKVGYIKNPQADTIIDASGKIVSPGFIDSHNHSDLSIMAYPDATNALLQGVTTIIIGNCGFSAAPALSKKRDLLYRYWSTLGPLPVEITWNSFGEYLDQLERVKPAVNIAPLVGHGTLRIAAMGFDARSPDQQEMNLIKSLLVESLNAGAFGISTGLIYPPGSFSSTSELIELAKVVAEHGGIYVSHIRGESHTLIPAVQEAIEIGKQAKIPVEISHHKASGKDNWGKVKETLKLIEDARGAGVEVNCDVYPYTAGMTMLSAVLPKWAHEGGIEALISRLRDPLMRARIREQMEKDTSTWENFARQIGWENIVVSYSDKCKYCEGKSIAEISKAWNLDPYDVVFEILIKDECKSTMITHSMREEDVVEVIKSPFSMIGSDSWVLPTEGRAHPRFFGTFPRIIKRYVKELGALRLEEAVRKMTTLPAEKFRLFDRGYIGLGYKADIVIFDFKKISDQATFEEPTKLPIGIEYVIVNGTLAVEEGVVTKVRSGEVIRRSE